MINTKTDIVEWVVAEFMACDGSYKREAVDLALRHRRAITPRLLDIVEAITTDPIEYLEANIAGQPNYYALLYSLFLLAYFREPLAHRLLLELFANEESFCNGALLGIEMGLLAEFLYATYPGSAVPLKEFISDDSVGYGARAEAIKTLTYCFAHGMIERTSTIEFIEIVFQRSRCSSLSDEIREQNFVSEADLLSLRTQIDERLAHPLHEKLREWIDATSDSEDFLAEMEADYALYVYGPPHLTVVH